ncbi:two-component system, OmpR family, osmolarity sensor histidine kinase EnvZ [Atopomonas hussainii]|uniref:histidine kinase n=2 Tax=Atopomonas hussainii TaxID=1429083 RepID=A0A1H7FSY5_9GAMM|nr:two-component system, OmpR family, osmolarity sensor histidine kinase EnvZ [Atopomonas hussainii]
MTANWLPRSIFARTLLLMLVVVLLSKVLTFLYLWANEDALVDRHYSVNTARVIKSYWATDAEDREGLLKALDMRTVDDAGVPDGEYHWPYNDIFQRQLEEALGGPAEVILRVANESRMLVRAPQLGPQWLEFPLSPHPLRGKRVWNILGWLAVIGLASTLSAWFLVNQLLRPFEKLKQAAGAVGHGGKMQLNLGREPSEMTEVYEAFNRMSDSIDQAALERELMLAGVSHDLRTPLTRMRLALELGAVDDPEMQDDMIRDIEDMNEILDQFIAFIRDGRDESEESVDLNLLVSEVVAGFNQREQCVSLKQEEIPLLPLRRVACKRMLSNLVGNALKYGGKAVEVRTFTEQDSVLRFSAVVSVVDRGPGVTEDDIERLFQPFARGDQSRGSSQGSGLGLSIVRRIAQLHGGSVELKNRQGGGLEARLRLPLPLED